MSDNKSAAPSHSLWIELSTRITTQRLHYRSGNEETAASSIYSLFGKCRGLMERYRDASEFHTLALELLNHTLRPYTARWHSWMTADKEERDGNGNPVLKFRDEWVRRQFRRELRALQPRLVEFEQRVKVLSEGTQTKPCALAKDPQAHLGATLEAGIGDQVRFTGHDESQWKTIRNNINDAELEEISARRKVFNAGQNDHEGFWDAAGIALSGGGIRSATFCLGIVSVLARRGLLGKFDYLSTVSGGGYFGSFLSEHLGTGATINEAEAQDPATQKIQAKKRIDDTFNTSENGSESPALRHLRNRSRYLLDDSSGRKSIEISLIVMGILFNLLIVLPVSLLAALVVFGLNKTPFFGEPDSDWTTGNWVPPLDAGVSWVFYILAALTVSCLLAYPSLKALMLRLFRNQDVDEEKVHKIGVFAKFQVGFGWLSLAVAVALVLWLIPTAFRIYHWIMSGEFMPSVSEVKLQVETSLGIFGLAATTVLGTIASKFKGEGRIGSGAKHLALISGPLLFLLVFFAVGSRILPAEGPDNATWHWAWVAVGTALLIAWAFLLVNVNTYSPHGYYRDRLSVCYLGAPHSEDRDCDNNKVNRIRLSELGSSKVAPYHLINTTVNLATSDNGDLRDRKGDFYVMSKHYCGSPVCGYYPTKNLEGADLHFDLGTAMAISGAAASSNMGWRTMKSVRLLMTLANVRLGYWMRNPKHLANEQKCLAGEPTTITPKKGPGPLMLFREMFALQMDEERTFLNLSDGGHIENLAVYELLRRRCKFIVCVDAGMEPGIECADLLRLERYAAIDLGIKMHYDLSDLALQPNGFSKAHGVLVKIDYAPPKDQSARKNRRPQDAQWGWMLYLKLGMIGYGPGYVMDYQRENPTFPHQSTGDQLYDEAQFEAYRALGEAAAESMFAEELVGSGSTENMEIRAWFQALASHLLPDNDEAFRAQEQPRT